jgi:hypothetical protein
VAHTPLYDFYILNFKIIDQQPHHHHYHLYLPQYLKETEILNNVIQTPFGVKSADSYLGALIQVLPERLSFTLFPHDFNTDRDPFPDRANVGAAYTPRANFSDFPRHGQLTPDVRIAYFVSRKGDVNFLGYCTWEEYGMALWTGFNQGDDLVQFSLLALFKT